MIGNHGSHYGPDEFVVSSIGNLQAVLDRAAALGGGTVHLRAGAYSTSVTYILGDNVWLIADPGAVITVTGAGTTLDVTALHGINTAALFTNADHAGGNTNIRISGVTVDFDTSTKTVQRDAPDRNYAAIHLGNCTDSLIDECIIDDVMLGMSAASYWRAFGVLFTNCSRSIVRDCETTNCGYEGVSFRDDCSYCTIDGLYGKGNSYHLAQAYGWVGSDAYYGTPTNITFKGIHTDGVAATDGILIHGANTGTKHIRFIDCRVPQIGILQHAAHVEIIGCGADVTHANGGIYICPIGAGAITDVMIEGYTASPAASSDVIRIWDGADDGCSVARVLISNCALGANGKIFIDCTAGHDMTVSDVSIVNTTMRIINVQAYGSSVVERLTISGGAIAFTDYSIMLRPRNTGVCRQVLVSGVTLRAMYPIYILGSDAMEVTDVTVQNCLVVNASMSLFYALNGGTGKRLAAIGNTIISAAYLFKEDGAGGIISGSYHSGNVCGALTAMDGAGANAPAAASIEGDGTTYTWV